MGDRLRTLAIVLFVVVMLAGAGLFIHDSTRMPRDCDTLARELPANQVPDRCWP